jgi:integrase
VREVLRIGETSTAFATTKLALRLLVLTAVRAGELRGVRWMKLEDLDTAEPVWPIPQERLKMGVE